MQRRSLFVSCALSVISAAIAAACSSSDSGATTPPASSEAGAADDASTTRHAPPLVDADVGPCAPGEIPGFQPPAWIPPAPFGQGKCTDAQMQSILACYLDENADQTACDQVLNDPANQPCSDCLVTDASTSKALGPLYIDGDYIDLNVAGCVANVDGDTSASGCGAKYLAKSVCEDQSCAENCTGTDDAAFEAYQACVAQAAESVCKTFATDGQCAEALIAPGGKAEKCVPNSGDFVRDAKVIAAMFCGGAASDGGSDASSDAPSDAPDDG